MSVRVSKCTSSICKIHYFHNERFSAEVFSIFDFSLAFIQTKFHSFTIFFRFENQYSILSFFKDFIIIFFLPGILLSTLFAHFSRFAELELVVLIFSTCAPKMYTTLHKPHLFFQRTKSS